MRVTTLCRMYKELGHVRYPNEAVLRAMDKIDKMIMRMRPSRKHQHFSIFLERYVDDGE